MAAFHYTNLFLYINKCACADLFQALEVIREGLALAALVYKSILNNGNLVDTLRFSQGVNKVAVVARDVN